jgi:predicted permease
MIRNLIADLVFAVRLLRKRPAATLAALLCLAIGIAATTSVFSLVHGVLLRPLPLEEPERLVVLWTHFLGRGVAESSSSAKEFVDYRDNLDVFSGVSAMMPWYFNLTGVEQPERLVGCRVSANFFSLLGQGTSMGRTFTLQEEEKRAKVVVLSHRLWQRRFGSDSALLGQSISLADQPYEVIGIMPQRFSYLLPEAELWIPAPSMSNAPRRLRFRTVTGRLAPGVTLEQAQAAADTLANRLQADHPESYPVGSGWGLHLKPLHEEVVGEVRSQLLFLAAAVLFVLLIACATVANLLLAQASSREKEMALRSALGGGKRALVRQLLTESLFLVGMGGLLGIVLAHWGVGLIRSLDLSDLPRLAEISINGRVLFFALASTLGTGVLLALAPLSKALRLDLFPVLKEGGKTSSGGSHRLGLRQALVIAQVAFAMLVLTAASLVIRAFERQVRVEPGFRTGDVVTMRLFLPRAKYGPPAAQRDFSRQLLTGLEELPGVTSFALASQLPLAAVNLEGSVQVENRPMRQGEWNPSLGWRMVSPGYFQTLDIPLIQGRLFTAGDHDEAPNVVLVGAATAQRLWPDKNPIGQRLELANSAFPGWRTVVGVVGEVRDRSLVGESASLLYMPLTQAPYPSISVVLHTSLDIAVTANAVREVVRAIDPSQPVGAVMTTGQLVHQALARPRLVGSLFAVFGLAALLLTLVGIYGSMAYSTSLRAHEMGLRLAMGSSPRGILLLVLRQGLRLILWGLFLGSLAAWLLAWLAGQYFVDFLAGLKPTDGLSILFSATTITLMALIAILLPARSARRTEPARILRQE